MKLNISLISNGKVPIYILRLKFTNVNSRSHSFSKWWLCWNFPTRWFKGKTNNFRSRKSNSASQLYYRNATKTHSSSLNYLYKGWLGICKILTQVLNLWQRYAFLWYREFAHFIIYWTRELGLKAIEYWIMRNEIA